MPNLYTIEEVMERVGKGKRAVEGYQKDGFIKPTKVHNPKGKDLNRYSEEAVQELEAYLAERDAEPTIEVVPVFAEQSAASSAESNAEGSAETGIAVPELPVFGSQGSLTLIALTQDQFKQLGTSTVPIKDKFLLTLEEAHQLSGLSVDQLRKAAVAEKMKATKQGRGWKVRPKALEAYCETLVPSE